MPLWGPLLPDSSAFYTQKRGLRFPEQVAAGLEEGAGGTVLPAKGVQTSSKNVQRVRGPLHSLFLKQIVVTGPRADLTPWNHPRPMTTAVLAASGRKPGARP